MSDSTSHAMSDNSDSQVVTTGLQDDFADDPQSDDEFGDLAGLPGRPRHVLVNRWTTLLAAIVLGGACFYGGVRVEKSKVPTASTSAAAGFAERTSAFTAAGRGAGGRSGAAGAPAGFAGGFGGAAGGAGGATSGTIATIDGDSLDVTETGGNTVKVDLSDATTLSKTSTVAKSKLYPGDTVSISGTSSTGSTGASSSSTSGSSALNSLFGG